MDQVLLALGDVSAPAGLEVRMLQRVQAHAAVISQSPAGFRQALARLLTPALALGSASALALLLALWLRHPAPVRPGATHSASSASVRPPVAAPSPTPLLARVPAAQGSVLSALEATAPVPGTVSPSRRRALAPSKHTLGAGQPRPASAALLSPFEQAALDDLHALSHPAPPMPLTAQERLIRRLIRRGEEYELAQLDPAAVAEANGSDQAAFETFFDPPPPPKPEGDTP